MGPTRSWSPSAPLVILFLSRPLQLCSKRAPNGGEGKQARGEIWSLLEISVGTAAVQIFLGTDPENSLSAIPDSAAI